MARPKTKKDLIEASTNNFEKLWDTINSLSEKEFSTPFDFSTNEKLKENHWKRDKNIRDILIHLYEWHQLLIQWINNNTSGKNVGFLPDPYNWKTYGEMNIKFWKKHQKTLHETSVTMVKNSHKDVMLLIESFENDELFIKKFFSWTGSTNLGSYCISATSSHYDWAIKKLKKHKKIVKASMI